MPHRQWRRSHGYGVAGTVPLHEGRQACAGRGGRPGEDPAPRLLRLQILVFNDYHGHLEASTPGPVGDQAAGGSEYLSTALNQLRAGKKYSLTVAAGDLIGGSPALSGLFHDEPSVESLNAMKMDVTGVGNHDFDEGLGDIVQRCSG